MSTVDLKNCAKRLTKKSFGNFFDCRKTRVKQKTLAKLRIVKIL